MKTILALTATLLISNVANASPDAAQKKRADAARADIQKTLGLIPAVFKQISDRVLPGAWEEMKGLQLNPNTALSGKVKELIGLGVASQIPCRYCIKAHTAFAKAAGATDQEIAEAVGMASTVRHWSTILNGHQADREQFNRELERIIANLTKKSS